MAAVAAHVGEGAEHAVVAADQQHAAGAGRDGGLRAGLRELLAPAQAHPPGEDVGLLPVVDRGIDVRPAGQHARGAERRVGGGDLVSRQRCESSAELIEHTVNPSRGGSMRSRPRFPQVRLLTPDSVFGRIATRLGGVWGACRRRQRAARSSPGITLPSTGVRSDAWCPRRSAPPAVAGVGRHLGRYLPVSAAWSRRPPMVLAAGADDLLIAREAAATRGGQGCTPASTPTTPDR